MIASRKHSSPARWKAHSFARWLVLCVFLAAATNGSALEKLHAPTNTSELAAGERKAAEIPPPTRFYRDKRHGCYKMSAITYLSEQIVVQSE